MTSTRPGLRAAALARSAPVVVAMVLVVLFVYMARNSAPLAVIGVGFAGLIAMWVVLGFLGSATLMIFLGMVFSPMTELTVIPGVTLVTFADLFFVLGFGMLVPTLFKHRATPPPIFLLGSLIVLSIGTVASLLAASPGLSVNAMMRLVSTAIAFPLIFMFWRPSLDLCRRLAQGYVIGVTISTLEGLSEGAIGDNRYVGLTEHPNVLGLTGLLAASLVPFIVGTSTKHRWVWWGAGGFCLLAVWLSGSRATLLAGIILALLYPAVERSAKALWLLLAAGAAGLFMLGRLMESDTDNALTRLLGGGSARGSDIERERQIDLGIDRFFQHPIIGNGFEGALAAHNIYLQVAISVGVLGLVGYLMILWSGFRPLLTAPHPLHRIAYPVLAYGMIGMLTSLLWDRYIWSVLALSFVIAARSHLTDDDPVPEPAPRDRVPREAVGALRTPAARRTARIQKTETSA